VTAFVALLRAVNVGGRQLAMADLKRIAGELGLDNPTTYIASGNLLFASRKSERELKKALETAIENHMGKPVGVICHGPWAMVEADAVRGRTMTSWPSVQTDLRNAGANWVDEEVVTCEHGPGVIVSSRKPDDLPAFCREIVHQFATSGDVAAARK